MGGLIVQNVGGDTYHLPAGGLPADEIVVPGHWVGMGTLAGQAVLIAESHSWIDAEFVYDCEEDPCTGDDGYMMGTGEQVFWAVPLSGSEPVELVRHVGTWGLSGAPEDVVSVVSVGGDRILLHRHAYGSRSPCEADCLHGPLPPYEQSWFEFRDLSGRVVDEAHNPAPVGSEAGAPLSWFPNGDLSADGGILIYEASDSESAVVAVDLDSGTELVRIDRGSRRDGEPNLTEWSFDRNRTLLTIWEEEPGSVASTEAQLVRLSDTGSGIEQLDLPEAFIDHLTAYDVYCCQDATYAPNLGIDLDALNPLSQLPPDLNVKLTLQPDGISSMQFGDSEEEVLTELTALLGAPVSDRVHTGPWPDETGCAGATGYGCEDYLRTVSWELPELRLVFTDGSPTATPAPPHFAGWSYDGGMALATPEGITFGMHLDQLQTLLGLDLPLPIEPDPETGIRGFSINGIGIQLTDMNVNPTYVWRLHAGDAFPSL